MHHPTPFVQRGTHIPGSFSQNGSLWPVESYMCACEPVWLAKLRLLIALLNIQTCLIARVGLLGFPSSANSGNFRNRFARIGANWLNLTTGTNPKLPS